MTCGVYILKFRNTDKVYIGQALNIERRFIIHKSNMRLGTSSISLNNAYKIYGEPALDILCECLEDELDENEEMAIELFDSIANGFNIKNKSGYRAHIYKEQNPTAGITNEEAKSILKLLVYDPKLNHRDISDILNVPRHTVKDISAGVTFTWLKDQMPVEYKLLESLKYNRSNGELNNNSQFTKDQIINAFNILVDNKDVPITRLSENINIPYSTLKSIANGVNHKWLKDLFPEKYALLLSYKGSRPRGKDAQSMGKTYLPIKSPDGEIYNVTNIKEFARTYNLNDSHLGRVLRGQTLQHKGWSLA